jgi:integral membrane sensor domain MASE1
MYEIIVNLGIGVLVSLGALGILVCYKWLFKHSLFNTKFAIAFFVFGLFCLVYILITGCYTSDINIYTEDDCINMKAFFTVLIGNGLSGLGIDLLFPKFKNYV